MFAKILAAIDDRRQSQPVLDLVRTLGVPGCTEVHIVHFRLREMSGYRWYARETGSEASFVAEAAVFDLRMAGLAAAAEVSYAYVDRVGQAILAEARNFGADLIVLGSPRRGEIAARLFGSVTQRVVQRSGCSVLIAPRRAGGPAQAIASGVSAPGRLS